MDLETDSEDALPNLEQKRRRIREAMQPIEQQGTYILGSLKSRQRRLQLIQQALHGDVIVEPMLDDLNEEQLDVLRLAVDGCSLFITGAGGT